jgi:VIT1/CCC1 family predicted Fe2+/Mn2+ transporter
MAHDALGAHARDELGISAALPARPVQAALSSAGSFAVGATLPHFRRLVLSPSEPQIAIAGIRPAHISPKVLLLR